MEINFILVIGVGLATLFVGYFVGMFERRGGDKEPRAQPPPAASRPGGPENSLLRLSLDGNNQLQLDVDGQRAEASGLNPEQRKRVIDLMVMIRPWVDASAPRPPAPAPSRPVTAPVPRPAEKAAAPGQIGRAHV